MASSGLCLFYAPQAGFPHAETAADRRTRIVMQQLDLPMKGIPIRDGTLIGIVMMTAIREPSTRKGVLGLIRARYKGDRK